MRRKIYIAVSIILALVVSTLLISKWYQNKVELNEVLKERNTRIGIEVYQNELEAKNQFVKSLPYETAEFEVHYRLEDRESQIVSYIVVVNMGEISEENDKFGEVYFANLEIARLWIADQGFDMDELDPEIVVEHD